MGEDEHVDKRIVKEISQATRVKIDHMGQP